MQHDYGAQGPDLRKAPHTQFSMYHHLVKKRRGERMKHGEGDDEQEIIVVELCTTTGVMYWLFDFSSEGPSPELTSII